MRVLFLTPQPPDPPHAGNALRNSGLMRGVAAAGHEVYLLTLADPDRLAASRPALDEYCAWLEAVAPPHRAITHRLRDLLLTPLADMQRRCFSPLFVRRLEHLLAHTRFDIVQIEGLEMAPYAAVVQRLQPTALLIYDAHNAEFHLQRTIYQAEKHHLAHLPGTVYSFIQWRRLMRFERQLCQSVAHIIAVSEADAQALRELAPGCPISVVPNGIDTAAYTQSDTSLDLGRAALVFTGSMGYRPNVDAALWFADEVLGRVRVQVPDARFFVVGSQPHARLAALRQRDGIEITGWVPNVNPFLHAAAVYVVPLRMGSGTRLKLLQAMAAGRAVVSTRVGAQGLEVHDGVELCLADNAEAFAKAIVTLLENPAQRRALGEAAACYVQTHYDWSVIVPRLLHVYGQLGPAVLAPQFRESSA